MLDPFPDVMLLAAGLGRRLRPLTDTRPKPLIEVSGTPLLDRVVDAAMAEGASRFVVNAHYLADQLVAHVAGLQARHGGAEFEVVVEDKLLDTGGGVNNVLPLLKTDPILVMNTDAFWLSRTDSPLTRMAGRLVETGAEAVLLCVHPSRAVGFRRSHDFCLDPDRRITNDFGLPVIYAGVALMRRRLFEGAPAGAFSLLDLLLQAQARETLFGVLLDAVWMHVGDPAARPEAELALRAIR